jgi:hypothetical protein
MDETAMAKDVDYEQMCSYVEATRPNRHFRRTPRGHWLEAGKIVDPVVLEWLDANMERVGERFGDLPVDAARVTHAPKAA